MDDGLIEAAGLAAPVNDAPGGEVEDLPFTREEILNVRIAALNIAVESAKGGGRNARKIVDTAKVFSFYIYSGMTAPDGLEKEVV